jgi:hypothetical protein
MAYPRIVRVFLYLDARPTAGVYNTHLIAFTRSLIGRIHLSNGG